MLNTCLQAPLDDRAAASVGNGGEGRRARTGWCTSSQSLQLQDQLLHEKFYSSWHMPDNPVLSCCNSADCYPTEVRYVERPGSTRGAGKTGSTSSFHPRRSSETGTIPTAATIFARRRYPPLWSTRSTASRWEVPREIHIGERQDPFPQDVLSMVLRGDQWRLSARREDAAALLRLRVLRAPSRSGAVDREASASGVLS